MSRALVVSFLICVLAHNCVLAGPVVLSSSHRPAPGFTQEETTTIELKDGHAQIKVADQPIKGAANALLRDRLTRTFPSADEQQLEFHECTRNIIFALGSKAGDPKAAAAGQLNGKTVRGTRAEGGGWKFTLGSKPTQPEETALKQFSAFNVAMESVARIYGDDPRETGKPWRPDFSAISKTYPGITVTIDCRLDEVTQIDGDERAKITVGGLITAQYGGGNHVEARFTGFIIRSLRDQVDVQVELAGTLRFRGAIGKTDDEGKGGSEATLDAPLTLKRSVKVTRY